MSTASFFQQEIEYAFIVCFIIFNGYIVLYSAALPNLFNQITVGPHTICLKFLFLEKCVCVCVMLQPCIALITYLWVSV